MIKKVVLLLLATLSLMANAKDAPCIYSLLSRSMPIAAVERQKDLLALEPVQARAQHLSEYEKLAEKLAQEFEKRAPSVTAREAAIRPFLERYANRPGTYDFGLFLPRAEFDMTLILDLARRAAQADLARELRTAVQTKTLTYEKLLDLSVTFAFVMTIAERMDHFGLTERENLRLWEYLAGLRKFAVDFYPLVSLRVHFAPQSIESTVAMSPYPIFPLQLVSETVSHEAENEKMSPIETFAHDIFHMARRLEWYFTDLFPEKRANPFFPKWINPVFKKPIIEAEGRWTGEGMRLAYSGLEDQTQFFQRVFAELASESAEVQAAAEAIWFSLYYSGELNPVAKGSDTTMSPQGLIGRLKLALADKYKFWTLGRHRAEFGQRYKNVDEALLRETAAKLIAIAEASPR